MYSDSLLDLIKFGFTPQIPNTRLTSQFNTGTWTHKQGMIYFLIGQNGHFFPSQPFFCPITYDNLKIANIIDENNQILCKNAFDTAMDKIRGMPLNEGERDSKKLKK